MLKSNFKKIATLIAALLVLGTLCACNDDSTTAAAGDEYAPVSSLTLPETEAAALSGKMHFRIYYANATGTKLASETRLVDYNRQYRRTDALAKDMLSQMLEAPQNSNLQKTMPDNTEIHSVVVAGNIATVDLNSAFYECLAAEPKTAPLVLASIVTTLTELKEITYVSFVCDGQTPNVAEGTLNFSKLTRNTANVAASLEITTLAALNEEALEAAIALEEEPALE